MPRTGASHQTPTAALTLATTLLVACSTEPLESRYFCLVDNEGDGMGRVLSEPAGIDCGAECLGVFAKGASVTLTASAASGSDFEGWSGPCEGDGACVLEMTEDRRVRAVFRARYQLTVAATGDGAGTVEAWPAGRGCGSGCAEHPGGTRIAVTATAASDCSVFAGWSGACEGTGPCEVTMDGDRTVVATFLPLLPLSIATSGDGAGRVVRSPEGMDCDNDGIFEHARGTDVRLTALPGPRSVFAGWSGACSGDASTCVTTMEAAREVTAEFSAIVTLTVDRSAGDGAGTVTSTPAGIHCGPACSADFASGTEVWLSALPAADSTFAGWSGLGCEGTGGCSVVTSSTASVAATFLRLHRLRIERVGDGSGEVVSWPSGIACGADCEARYPTGTAVALLASADPGSRFEGWTGACEGLDPSTAERSASASSPRGRRSR